MVQIVNRIDGARLLELADYESMLQDFYLQDRSHPQTKFIYEQFFKEGTDTTRNERLKLLNMASSIPALIAEKIADYTGSPENTVDVDIYESLLSFVWGGIAVLKVRNSGSKLLVENAKPYGYVRYSDGSEQLLTYLDVDTQQGGQSLFRRYIFEQIYTPGKIVNKLYLKGVSTQGVNTGIDIKNPLGNADTTQNQGIAIYGEEVPLTTLEITENIKPVVMTGLQRNPIVTIENSFEGMGDLKRVRSLISSIEVQLINLQDQFLKHLQAKLAMPISKAVTDASGNVDIRQLEAIFMEAGDPRPEYIMNNNPLIDKAFVMIDMLLRQIASVLSIPNEFLGLEGKGGAETADAKQIRISSFLKKIERIREKAEDGLEEVYEIGVAWGLIDPEVRFEATWGEVFPIDKTKEATELEIALTNGMISKKKAIMRYQDIDELCAMEELERINKDNADVVNGENMFEAEKKKLEKDAEIQRKIDEEQRLKDLKEDEVDIDESVGTIGANIQNKQLDNPVTQNAVISTPKSGNTKPVKT